MNSAFDLNLSSFVVSCSMASTWCIEESVRRSIVASDCSAIRLKAKPRNSDEPIVVLSLLDRREPLILSRIENT